MYVIVVQLRSHSLEDRHNVLDALSAVALAARKEAGVIEYKVTVDPLDPLVLHSLEIYESDEAIAAHIASGRMADFASTIAGLAVDVSLKAFSGRLEAYHLDGLIDDELIANDSDSDELPASIH